MAKPCRAVGDVVEEMDAARKKSMAFIQRARPDLDPAVSSDPSMRRASRSFSRVGNLLLNAPDTLEPPRAALPCAGPPGPSRVWATLLLTSLRP